MDAPFPARMMPSIEHFFREVHPTLTPGQDVYPEVFASELFFPLQRPKELEAMIRLARGINPVTVAELGCDKGGGLYHWAMCLPTVENVIGCEIRGTPYRDVFEKAWGIRDRMNPLTAEKDFLWCPHSSLNAVHDVRDWMDGASIDVLFIDGDKAGMLKDFDAYLPLMRRPGGVVFMHDVSDDMPARAFTEIMRRGFRTELILDRSEGLEAGEREDRGEQPRNPHDGWLMHWRGRSCGVGVIYV